MQRSAACPVVEFRDLTYKQMLATGSMGAQKVAAMKSLELSFCKAADCVVALTDGFKKDLEAAGVPGDSIVIVPNGADVVACKHMWDGPCVRLLWDYGIISGRACDGGVREANR